MELLSLTDSIALSQERARQLYKEHQNAGLLRAYDILGFGNIDIESAEGVEIKLRNGRTVLDFSSAIGVLGLGHNHPRIIAAERLCHEKKLIDAFKVGPNKLQAALAYNIACWLPEPLQVSFFTTSGAEAVEAAMKLCEKIQGPDRTKFLCASGGFHGKTHGALSLTRVEGFQDGFLLGVPESNVIEVPYGNVEAVRDVVSKDPTIIALFVEPIQGEAIVEPPFGYLTEVARICREHGVLVVFDEVKMGMGRTGTFCAFQNEDVVPDVVTLSKALGGGKRAIGAMVTSKELFAKAYGKRKDWAGHTTTFGGLGESCAVAIETLNVYRDEGLIESVKEKGSYLKEKLFELKQKHPDKIVEIRGRGLIYGIRFNFGAVAKDMAKTFSQTGHEAIFRTIDGVSMACVIRELYREHGIVTHFSGPDPDVLHIMPPLIVEQHHLDHLVASLDQVFSKGVVRLSMNLLKAS